MGLGVNSVRKNTKKYYREFSQESLNIDSGYVQSKPYDHELRLLSRVSDKLPDDLKSGVRNVYVGKKGADAFRGANESINRVKGRLEAVGVSLSSSDETIAFVARGQAKDCKSMGDECPIMGKIMALFSVTLRTGIEVEDIAGKSNDKKYLRIIDSDWWERRIRTLQLRAREQIARELGFVHKKANVYVSDEAVKRVELRRQHSWEILKTLDCVNQDNQDERLNMFDVAKKSMANPTNRVNELYARNKGFDAYCQRYNHVADFFTLTCPSRYHAYHYSGYENNKFFQSEMPTPRDGQKYLTKTWSRIRAKFKRAKLQVYGMRTVEPHHDGTPHWHMVLYCARRDRQKMRRIIRMYSIQEDIHELCDDESGKIDYGKVKARYDVMPIDFSKGSGASYLFKYLLKNLVGVKGEGVGSVDFETATFDDEGNLLEGQSTTSTASRVSVWASVWGIRQFQSVGGASVGVWRELRRERNLKESDTTFDIYNLWLAADVVEYEAFLILMGGADCPMRDQAMGIFRDLSDAFDNKYDEELEKVIGVVHEGEILVTRLKRWKIEPAEKEKSTERVLSDDEKISAAMLAVDQILNRKPVVDSRQLGVL